jgi:hypothetical protein
MYRDQSPANRFDCLSLIALLAAPFCLRLARKPAPERALRRSGSPVAFPSRLTRA